MQDALLAVRVIPVCSVESVEEGLHMAEALYAGGLPCAEITFRTEAAADVIEAILKRFPDMLVGAGTVLTTSDLQRAIDSGAKFAVAPGCSRTVVSAALADGFPFFPGVATPSDIERALELGVRILKLFPAEAIGGVDLLKALAGPYRHTGARFVPTGGIRLNNMKHYLDLPDVLAVGGSWMVDPKLMAAGDWAAVTRLTAEAVALAKTHH